VKFEPFADADRVHHMLLYGCDQPAFNAQFWKGGQTCAGNSHILYAWARNAPSLSLPENVAFPIGNPGDPVKFLVLQIHYARPFVGNVRDFSGKLIDMARLGKYQGRRSKTEKVAQRKIFFLNDTSIDSSCRDESNEYHNMGISIPSPWPSG
jgi:hypothetical protein